MIHCLLAEADTHRPWNCVIKVDPRSRSKAYVVRVVTKLSQAQRTPPLFSVSPNTEREYIVTVITAATIEKLVFITATTVAVSMLVVPVAVQANSENIRGISKLWRMRWSKHNSLRQSIIHLSIVLNTLSSEAANAITRSVTAERLAIFSTVTAIKMQANWAGRRGSLSKYPTSLARVSQAPPLWYRPLHR